MSTALQLPPLALYVHFPWCVQKCPYCDFNSYTLRETLPEQRYLDALLADLHAQHATLGDRQLVSVFLGGGTPSLFSPAAIGRLLADVQARFRCVADLEVTLEANPGTIERGRFAEYRAAGVTRVSLGAQSFSESQLKLLGRIHTPGETERAAEELHAAGLVNFNLDLMYALPGQTPEEAEADLGRALALEPQHISHYQLTIEPGTVFAGAPPPLPGDDIAEEVLARCTARLASAGFRRYEVSAYARAGRESRHNLNYWSFGDYLGVGAGAHGKLTQLESATIVRTTHQREPRRYLAQIPAVPAAAIVAADQLPFEFMLNALRCLDGFDEALFETRTGLPIGTIGPVLEKLRARDLLAQTGSRWHPTERGIRFLNEALVTFLPD